VLAGTGAAVNASDETAGVTAAREPLVGTWSGAIGVGFPEETSQQVVPLGTAWTVSGV
jgi:hypothetical protein